MKLYEIVEGLEEIVSRVEDGELTDEEASRSLELLEGERDAKVTSILRLIKNQIALQDAIRGEVEKLTTKATRISRKVDWLKNYLSHCLGEGTTFQSPDGCHAIGWRSSTRVDVLDLTKIPQQWVHEKVTVVPDKRAIREAIKCGTNVPGASLSTHQHIQVE